MNSAGAPYAQLSPEAVLAAVESAGVATDGRVLALNSFENRVYQIGVEDDKPLVAKFYRGGRWSDAAIREEHAFALELAAAELPVVAPLVFAVSRSMEGSHANQSRPRLIRRSRVRACTGFGESGQGQDDLAQTEEMHTLLHYSQFRFALYPRQGGRAPELESAENLMWMGRLLARLHGVGSREVFRARGTLDRASLIHAPSKAVLASPLLPSTSRDRYARTIEVLDALIAARFASVDGVRNLRLHGDCHAGNVLWTDSGPHFVDLDDARMGPAVQDLWMLAPSPRALDILLEGYAEFRDFDRRELTLVEPLRVMRQIHYAGWIAQRWDDPAFPRAFPFAAEAGWWERHLNDLLEAAGSLELAE